jgi:hypothetical protein
LKYNSKLTDQRNVQIQNLSDLMPIKETELKKYWVIKTLPSGKFYVTHEWLHQTSDIEVYHTEEEANDALCKKIKALSEKGNCPRCYNKFCTTTTLSLSHLSLLLNAKKGSVYVCNNCKTHWFVNSAKHAIAYATEVADYLLEWCTRPLVPNLEQSNILQSCLDISRVDNVQLYAVGIKLKNGKNFPKAYLTLHEQPPSEHSFFTTKKWHYLDTVEEVYLSPYAFDKTLASQIKKMKKEDVDEYFYFKDEENNTYKMSPSVGYFMPDGLLGKKMEWKGHETRKRQQEKSILLSVHSNYEPPYEYTVFPSEIITVYGDLPMPA